MALVTKNFSRMAVSAFETAAGIGSNLFNIWLYDSGTDNAGTVEAADYFKPLQVGDAGLGGMLKDGDWIIVRNLRAIYVYDGTTFTVSYHIEATAV